jgi:3-hydroxybutyryl-CoA dehydrogenase
MTTSRPWSKLIGGEPFDGNDQIRYLLTGESTRGSTTVQERLGIAGAGAIATGLATVAAARGDVVMAVRSDAAAQRARAAVEKGCAKAGNGADPGRVRIETDTGALAETTYVVEAIVEELDAKAELLRCLHAEIAPEAILATTTSSLSIRELAHASGRPGQFVGLHVFNPVPRMDLVELVFPDEASDEVRARTRALCDALGKTAIEVPDVPGFVVNRLLFPYLFNAVRLLDETGMEPEHVDLCMKLGGGHPMGPLALLDLIGLDVAAAIGEQIGADVPERVRTMIAEGRTGRKAGGGFYDA